MKQKDRFSAGMTPQKVSDVYAILKERFEEHRRREKESEALRKSVIPDKEKKST